MKMKKLFKNIILLATVLTCGCSTFDDSDLRDRIDGYMDRIEKLQQKAETLNSQIEALGSLTNGNVITDVSQDSDGKFVITYRDDSDQVYTVVLATMDDLLDVPVLGVALDEEEGIYYWTRTVDGQTSWLTKGEGGERIPVRGNTPVLSVDEQGYWTVDGERINDADGNPVEANDEESSLFREASFTDGTFSLTLANGEVITLQVFDTLNLRLQTTATVTVVDPDAGYRIAYDLTGEAADRAIVAIAKECGGAKAALDTEAKRIDVTFDSSFSADSGAHIIVMAYDLERNVVIKPVFFTMAADSRITIATKEQLRQFATDVNAGAIPAGMQVLLTQDIDMAGVNDWVPIGNATISAASNVSSITVNAGYPFTGVFDGGGHAIRNLVLETQSSDAEHLFGLFGMVRDAEIRNLQIGEENPADRSSLTVKTSASVWAGTLVGLAVDSKISDCTSYADVTYDSTTASSRVFIGGMVGCCFSDETETYLDQLKNYGAISADVHGNTNNGLASAPHIGGVCALTSANTANKQVNHIEYCANYGNIESNAARTAGIIGAANSYTAFNSCTNYGNQTNSVGDTGRLGAITVILGTGSSMIDCVNYGDLVSTNGARVGGIVSLPNNATNTFSGCANYGKIISDAVYRGVFFGYNSVASTWVNCTAGGQVGVYNGGNYIFDSYADDMKELYLGPQGANKAQLSNIIYQIGTDEGETPTGPEPTLRILCIGNSFTKDAVEHLPKMIAAAGIETVKIIHMYYGGRTVPEYFEGYDTTNDYTCYMLNTGTDVWTSFRGMTLKQAAASDKWDIVTIQEHTGNYRAWSWTAEEKAAITGLIDCIKADQGDNIPEFKYIMSQAYFDMNKIGTGSRPYMTFSTQDEMFDVIAAQAKKVLAETEIDEVIPTGTVLQNLRTSSLNNEMDLTRDGYHMDYGISRYAAACAVFEMLISPAFDGVTLDDNPFRYDVTSTATGSYTTPVTDTNRLIALQAARYAMARPFEVTDMSAPQNIPDNGIGDMPSGNDTDKE